MLSVQCSVRVHRGGAGAAAGSGAGRGGSGGSGATAEREPPRPSRPDDIPASCGVASEKSTAASAREASRGASEVLGSAAREAIHRLSEARGSDRDAMNGDVRGT